MYVPSFPCTPYQKQVGPVLRAFHDTCCFCINIEDSADHMFYPHCRKMKRELSGFLGICISGQKFLLHYRMPKGHLMSGHVQNDVSLKCPIPKWYWAHSTYAWKEVKLPYIYCFPALWDSTLALLMIGVCNNINVPDEAAFMQWFKTVGASKVYSES